MDKHEWIQLLTFGTAAVIVVALVGVVRARQRDQVVLPFLLTVIPSFGIYPLMVHGSSSFHTAIAVCCGVAVVISVLLVRFQPWRSKLATLSWAMLGVVLPYALAIGLLTAACAGQTECLG